MESKPADLSADVVSELSVVKLRHPWRWIAASAVSLFAVMVLWSVINNPNFDWPTVGEYLFRPITLSGVLVTLYLTVISVAIGLVGGVFVALMRLSDNAILVNIAKFYIWLFRGTPVLVQIIFWGYLGALYPSITLGIPFTDVILFDARTSDVIGPVLAAILALGLNEVAYAAEIIRGGILSIDHGQKEAAYSLGIGPAATNRRIILPQAMRVIIPPMGNEVITMLKTTALVSVIAGQDLLSNMQQIYAQNYKVIPLLLVATIWYLVLSSVLSVPQQWLEKRYGRGQVVSGNKSVFRRMLLGGFNRNGN